MSARSTFHHLDAIGFSVGSIFGSLLIDVIAARREDIVARRMAARRARIERKLALVQELRNRRLGR